MRYCPHCGHVHDEFDVNREDMNCWKCSAILKEDDMTALKFAQLSETEKDEYERQLIEKMRNEIAFSEEKFQSYNSMKDGKFWSGFRPDKYLELHTFKKEEYREMYINWRKENEPFKPFPPIDKEKARAYTYSTPVEQKQENNNIPKCPTCQSTNIRKMGGVERGASIWAFGLFSKKINKTFKCNSCGYTW